MVTKIELSRVEIEIHMYVYTNIHMYENDFAGRKRYFKSNLCETEKCVFKEVHTYVSVYVSRSINFLFKLSISSRFIF